MTREPTGQRRAELLAWLMVAGLDRFQTELQMTTAATAEVWADGAELDFLASRWRQLKGDAMTTDAPDQTAALAVREPTRMDELARLGSWLAAAESDSDDRNAKGAAAALRLYYAQELGLTPLAAAELSIVKGRLVVGAKLLRAMAQEAGYRVVRVEATDDSCTAALLVAATGEELGRTTYTMADAQKAGLVRDRSAWKTHPQRMLWARATKFVLDDYAPAVSLGMLEDDEAAEITGDPTPPEPLPDPPPVVTESDIADGLAEAEDADFWPAPQEAADG